MVSTAGTENNGPAKGPDTRQTLHQEDCMEARATAEAKAGRATVTLKQRWEAAMDDKARSDRKRRRQAESGERSLP